MTEIDTHTDEGTIGTRELPPDTDEDDRGSGRVSSLDWHTGTSRRNSLLRSTNTWGTGVVVEPRELSEQDFRDKTEDGERKWELHGNTG